MNTVKKFAGMNFPVEAIQDRNIRLKLTSRCQWSCHFCHMEGSAGGQELKWSEPTGRQLLDLMKLMGRTKVHLTGGEPTTYKQVAEVVSFFRKNDQDVAITTNGQFTDELRNSLIESGCSSFSFSLPTLDAEEFIKFHKASFGIARAIDNVNRSVSNISAVLASGIKTDINLVFSDKIKTMSGVFDLAFSQGINISLLGVIGDLENSEMRIMKMISLYDLEPVTYRYYRGTSRARYVFKNRKSGTLISLKILEPVFLPSMCNSCPLQSNCEEKFYGIRVEQGRGGLLVRTCVHKNVLTPISDFPKSDIGKEVLEACK